MFHKTPPLIYFYCIRDWVDQLHSYWSVCTPGCIWRLPKGCGGGRRRVTETFKGINFQIFYFHMHPLIKSICLKRHSWPRFSFAAFPFCLSTTVQNKGVPHTHPIPYRGIFAQPEHEKEQLDHAFILAPLFCPQSLFLISKK